MTKRVMGIGALMLAFGLSAAAPAAADKWGFSVSIGRTYAPPVYVAPCPPAIVYYDYPVAYPVPVYYHTYRYYGPAVEYYHGGFDVYRHGHGRVYHHGYRGHYSGRRYRCD